MLNITHQYISMSLHRSKYTTCEHRTYNMDHVNNSKRWPAGQEGDYKYHTKREKWQVEWKTWCHSSSRRWKAHRFVTALEYKWTMLQAELSSKPQTVSQYCSEIPGPCSSLAWLRKATKRQIQQFESGLFFFFNEGLLCILREFVHNLINGHLRWS